MKRQMIVVSLLALAMTLAVTAFGLAAAGNGVVKADATPETRTFDDPADQISWDHYAAKAAKYGKSVEPEPLKDPFESYYEIATEEQRAKLDALYEEYAGLSWEHEREMKIIMGELPEDTPRLTREDAERICASVDVKEHEYFEEFEEYVAGLFNEIAGAPDLNGGSGIAHRVYYTDDSEQISISVWCGTVTFYDETNGERETLLTWN